MTRRLLWLGLVGLVAVMLGGSAAATLSSGGDTELHSVSCVAVGDCVAGGYYADDFDIAHAFVAGETGGSWGNAVDVPIANLNGASDAEVASVSCAAVGDCAAGGTSTD